MPFLDWVNKNQAVLTADQVPYHLLQKEQTFGDAEASHNNLIIQGDNLQALKALLPFYTSKVKCVYIDPPYNTGAAFEYYDDKLEHSQWLSLMYPRLVLLRELLTDDGFICVQIDDKEYARLYMLMIELFGEKNLKTISVKMAEPTGLKMASVIKSGNIPKLKEYLILAGKSGIKNLTLEKIPKAKWDSEYKTIILNKTQEQINRIKEIRDDEYRTASDIEEADKILADIEVVPLVEAYRKFNISNSNKNNFNFENAWRILQIASISGSAKSIADQKSKDINASFYLIQTPRKKAYIIKNGYDSSNQVPRIKALFADDYLTVHPGDFWQDVKTTGLDNEGTVDFKNGKKPELLIKRIIAMCSKVDDLILDSFLGSGTTAAVAHKMNRRYIGIEMGEHAKTHCLPRLQKVIGGEQGGISKTVNWQGGGGFSFYTLGDAVFDANGHISASVRFSALAAYIWHLETKTAISAKSIDTKTPFIGEHEGVAYYLLYNGILGDRRPNGGNVLTNPVLAYLDGLHQTPSKKVIFGEASRIGDAKLSMLNITFKQIPYELHERV